MSRKRIPLGGTAVVALQAGAARQHDAGCSACERAVGVQLSALHGRQRGPIGACGAYVLAMSLPGFEGTHEEACEGWRGVLAM